MTLTDIIFVICAGITVASALAVVTWRNPVYCVLALISSMCGVAAIFYLLTAPFIAAMQIIVYAGSIVVLFLFVIMLLNLKKEEMGEEMPVIYKVYTFILCGLFVMIAAIPVLRAFPVRPGKGMDDNVTDLFGTTQFIGWEIFSNYVLPFELIAVLIIVSLIGAVYLAKKRKT